MARAEEKVEQLVSEDPEMADALEAVLDHVEEGTVTWEDVSDDISTGQWSRLIQTSLLVDADGEGFTFEDPEEVREALESTEPGAPEDEEGSSWSIYDKLAAVGALGMFAGYSIKSVRNVVGGALDVVLGPLEALLPFYMVVMVLALFTGLYSTILQSNLMDMDKMSGYQEEIKEIQEREEKAKEQGDEEALDQIQQEKMEAMSNNMSMFTEQFRPMVWIMLITIPVFLWMYWMILSEARHVSPQTIVVPMAGEVSWTAGVLGPIQAWILWYFVCSMGFTQMIRKALNIQTTPT